MHLSDMADYICEVYGKTDSSTVATAKKFLRHRYRMICDSGLWKDMISVHSFPTKSRVQYLPEDVDRVIHVVFDSTSLDVNDLIRDAIVNPANISTADTETNLSTGSEVSMADMKVQVSGGILYIYDPDTEKWYQAVIRTVDGVPTLSIEGEGVASL